MIKLKKQVEKKKIRHLFNKSCIVLFIHCNDTHRLQRLFIEKHLSEPGFPHQAQTKRKVSDSCDKNLFTDYKSSRSNNLQGQQGVHYILVQNNNAKQVLLQDIVGNIESPRQEIAYKASQSKADVCKDFNFSKVDQQTKINSLLQGPTVLLGMHDLNSLDNTLHSLKDNGKFLLLGAVYEDSIINHSQVKNLALLSKESNSYEKLIYVLKESARLLCLVPSLSRDELIHVTFKQKQNKFISVVSTIKENKS